ncbi:hypothetical protein [Brevundimonas nasdae]|uniref:Uncharacterized protein n=1 Tax=Brevundimonas nasdae TaxID=172043 RepID=A0ACD4VNL0_9CAUL|nr:hypothetical protein [Brevundimonas nasdae]WOB78616.1 hypothetical protein PZA08_00220 [Brevundimonas nasdae]
MKIQMLLAGAAALALTAAPAMAGTVYHASATAGMGNSPSVQVNTANPAGQWYITAGSTINEQYNGGSAFPASASVELLKGLAAQVLTNSNQNVSLIQISGSSAADNGTASNNDGATFTLKGAVSTDCAYYTGNASTTIDFGTIGIYASDDTGPANAFDMTAPANVTIDTNLAGCNTSNTVTVSKNDIRGLVNNSGAGYDSNVFQANLPYSVTGTYTAGAVGSTAAATNGNYINLAANANSTSASHGAWKSAMALNVNIPVPSKSLLAGAYEGQLTVNIQAF